MSVKPSLGLVNKAPFTQLGQRAGKLGAGTEVHCFFPQRQSCVPGEGSQVLKAGFPRKSNQRWSKPGRQGHSLQSLWLVGV